MKKRVLGFILMLTMVTSLIPTDFVTGIKTAFATEEITRAEWVGSLVELFEMKVDDNDIPDDYFFDVEPNAPYYRDIMTATAFGLINIPAGDDFNPHDPVTRSFAAETVNFCLGFMSQENEEVISFSDSGDLPPSDVWADAWTVAVERKWFEPEGEYFLPNAPVTQAEKDFIFADASTVWASTQIDPNHENVFEFEVGVIEIPEDVPMLFVDGVVTIYDSPHEISVGDIFAVYMEGLPLIFRAASVSKDGNLTTIEVHDLDAWEFITYADAEGIIEVDLSTFEVYEADDDISVMFIEGGTAALNFEDGIEHASIEAFYANVYSDEYIIEPFGVTPLATVRPNAIRLSKNISLGQGRTVNFSVTISNIEITYGLSGGAHVFISGNTAVTVNGRFSSEQAGVPRKIPLGRIDKGIISIDLEAEIRLDGSVVINMTNNFNAGVQLTGGRVRVIRDFTRPTFTITSEIDFSAGIKLSANLRRIPMISGQIFVRTGVNGNLTNTTTIKDGQPIRAGHFYAYLYASVGANASIKPPWPIPSASINRNYDVFTRNNSPMRLEFHWVGERTYPRQHHGRKPLFYGSRL